MWPWTRPSAERIARLIEAERELPLTYSQRGLTNEDALLSGAPAGFALDHNQQYLGQGSAAFAAAAAALRDWTMFPKPWTAVEPYPAPIEPEGVVAVLVRTAGLWWLNTARIVYVVDEPRRFGFAYGTLPAHAECGEERFLVEQRDDGGVWYDLRAFSRPRYWAARLGQPVTRALQRHFARQSKAAMAAAVAAAVGDTVSR